LEHNPLVAVCATNIAVIVGVVTVVFGLGSSEGDGGTSDTLDS
jgi:hypothetical protein